MSTQNIDFAKKIQKPDANEKITRKEGNVKKNNYSYLIFLMGYVMGAISGFYFYKLKMLDEKIIKNPDQIEESFHSQTIKQSEFSNISSKREAGEYIIKIGEYSAKRSSEVIKILKKIDYTNIDFRDCLGLEEYQTKSQDDFRTSIGIFRIPTTNGKFHTIYLGCFHNEEMAIQAQKSLIKEFHEFGNSEVIKIEY